MPEDHADDREGAALASVPSAVAAAWRGDEHQLQLEAASEAGLVRNEVELDLYTRGFSSGMTIEDPLDGAIVARGRTVLSQPELRRSLRSPLQYLGVALDLIRVQVHDGSFELRIAKAAAEASAPALRSGKAALLVFVGLGLVGLAGYQFIMPAVGGLLWGVALVIGGWMLRRGTASGRAMLAGRVAIGLGMLAQQEQSILPPADAPTEEPRVR